MFQSIKNKIFGAISEKLQNVQGKDGVKKYGANTLWLFVGRFGNIILSFAVAIVIARHLSPAGFGQINFAISFVSLFSFLTTFGTDSIVIRDLIRKPEDTDKILGTSLAIKIVGGFIAVIGSTISILILSSSFDERLFVIVYSISFIFQCLNIIDLYYQAKVLSRRSVVSQLGAGILSSLAKIVLVLSNASILYILMAYVLETFLTGLFLLISWIRSEEHSVALIRIKFDSTILKNMLAVSWPLMLTSIAAIIYARIDQVMIKGLLGNTDLGIYSSAVKLAEGWYFIPGIITASLFPALVGVRTNKELYLTRVRWLYAALIGSAFCIGLGTTFFGKWAITFVFGSAYTAGYMSLILYTWAGVGVFLGTGIGQHLITEGHTKILFTMTLSGAIMNIILNTLLIPIYGINGSAFSTLVSYSFTLVILLLFKASRNHLKEILWIHKTN